MMWKSSSAATTSLAKRRWWQLRGSFSFLSEFLPWTEWITMEPGGGMQYGSGKNSFNFNADTDHGADLGFFLYQLLLLEQSLLLLLKAISCFHKLYFTCIYYFSYISYFYSCSFLFTHELQWHYKELFSILYSPIACYSSDKWTGLLESAASLWQRGETSTSTRGRGDMWMDGWLDDWRACVNCVFMRALSGGGEEMRRQQRTRGEKRVPWLAVGLWYPATSRWTCLRRIFRGKPSK